jgi:uncharacterized coiled-coil protein SlyX
MGQAARKLNLEPEPELLSISEIGRRCGINRTTAASRLDDLGYEADESSTPKLQLYAFDDEMLFSIKSAKDSLSAAKIRDIRAASQIKEIKLAEMRGELVPINDTIERIQAVMSKMYKEFTQMQPKRLASRLAKAKTAAEITKVLKLDTDKIFFRLRENDEAFVPKMKR